MLINKSPQAVYSMMQRHQEVRGVYNSSYPQRYPNRDTPPQKIQKQVV